MTSTGAKITFGNNAATTYSVNNTNFGYATGDNVGGSYSPYSQQPASSLNTVNAAGYGGIQQQRSTSPINQRGTVGQSLLNTYTSGQTVTPVTTSFENRTIPVPAQNNTKVTFGGKQFSSQFVPQQQARYEPVTNYVAPVPQYHQSYQTYQSYQKPVEIAPVVATQQIQSQPIRQQEVQVQQRQYQPARVSNKGSKVDATPIRESTTTKGKKQKKGGCPAWLWPMLGILALLALILGLLFGLGVFGRIGNAGAGGNIQKQGQTTPTAVGTNATTTTTTPVITPVDTTGTTTTVTTPTTGTTTTQQQPGYTVMDETVVVSKNDTTSSTTQAVTSPTTTPTTTTVDTTYTPTTYTPTTYTPTYTPVTTVDNTYTTNVPAATTTTTDDDFGIDPSSFAPSPVAASTTTGTYSTDSNTVYTSTPYAAGTTYPTVSGYGSNPDFDFVQPTTSAQ